MNRLKGIEVCVHGIQRLVEVDCYCIDILNQTCAIQDTLAKVEAMILEEHLEACVATAIWGGEPAERERVTRELLLLSQGGLSIGRGRDLPSVSRESALASASCGNRRCQERPTMSDDRPWPSKTEPLG